MAFRPQKMRELEEIMNSGYDNDLPQHRRVFHHLIINCAQTCYACKPWPLCRKIGVTIINIIIANETVILWLAHLLERVLGSPNLKNVRPVMSGESCGQHFFFRVQVMVGCDFEQSNSVRIVKHILHDMSVELIMWMIEDPIDRLRLILTELWAVLTNIRKSWNPIPTQKCLPLTFVIPGKSEGITY